jgi:hypothetical protein
MVTPRRNSLAARGLTQDHFARDVIESPRRSHVSTTPSPFPGTPLQKEDASLLVHGRTPMGHGAFGPRPSGGAEEEELLGGQARGNSKRSPSCYCFATEFNPTHVCPCACRDEGSLARHSTYDVICMCRGMTSVRTCKRHGYVRVAHA